VSDVHRELPRDMLPPPPTISDFLGAHVHFLLS